MRNQPVPEDPTGHFEHVAPDSWYPGAQPVVDHTAFQPVLVTVSSDTHSISMNPVLDVTVAGAVVPDTWNSSEVLVAHALVSQLHTDTVS